MIPLKTPEELARMRISGRMAGQVRDALARAVAPGVSTAELDELARELIEGMGAVASFKGYRGYPAHICVSINEEVIHGIPGPRRIQPGDLVSLDVGVFFDGFHGDTAVTVAVGVSDPRLLRLAEVTRQALDAAVAQARPGNRLGDVSHAVQAVAEEAGFSVVREFVGHGIGRRLHEEPNIPNHGPAGRGPRLAAGMVLAIEPMVNLGVAGVETLEDGWTAVTRDRLPSAHFEHTVAVGPDGPEILTRGA